MEVIIAAKTCRTTGSIMAEAEKRGLRTVANDAEERDLFSASNMPEEMRDGIFWNLVVPVGYQKIEGHLAPQKILVMSGMAVYPAEHCIPAAGIMPEFEWENPTAFLFIK